MSYSASALEKGSPKNRRLLVERRSNRKICLKKRTNLFHDSVWVECSLRIRIFAWHCGARARSLLCSAVRFYYFHFISISIRIDSVVWAVSPPHWMCELISYILIFIISFIVAVARSQFLFRMFCCFAVCAVFVVCRLQLFCCVVFSSTVLRSFWWQALARYFPSCAYRSTNLAVPNVPTFYASQWHDIFIDGLDDPTNTHKHSKDENRYSSCSTATFIVAIVSLTAQWQLVKSINEKFQIRCFSNFASDSPLGEFINHKKHANYIFEQNHWRNLSLFRQEPNGSIFKLLSMTIMRGEGKKQQHSEKKKKKNYPQWACSDDT